jgi:sulfite dehydrogenase (quinone) subunit SoeC
VNPALSVIFFSTLSGAGYGLLAWQGTSLLIAFLRGNPVPELHRFHQWILAGGMALAVAGLLCSLAHLGRPERAWRAFSQWRTSWLSREGVVALATLVPALALLWLLRRPPSEAAVVALLGALLAALALATVVCTAMIYASLRPIPAWRHVLVVPGYLAFSLATGQALQYAAMARWLGAMVANEMLLTIVGYGIVLAALKWAYWYEIDRTPGPASRGDAVGLPEREVSTFERPQTEGNFVTREMAFVVARRHGTALRWLATVLLAGGPLLAMVLLAALGPAPALTVAALSLLLGALVERWLFFAQARHLVTLYY